MRRARNRAFSAFCPVFLSAEPEDLFPQGHAVHFGFPGEDGGLAAEVGEEVLEGHGFQSVVHLAIGVPVASWRGCGPPGEPRK